MKSIIDNYDILIEDSHEKKLLSALNRIQKAHDEIIDMGYTAYVEAEGNYNVMNGETHAGVFLHAENRNVVASVSLKCIDMGAW